MTTATRAATVEKQDIAYIDAAHAWDEITVARYLPDVPVKLAGGTFVGQVSGRMNKFATVTVRPNPAIAHEYISLECAWSMLADVLNRKAAVTA